MHSLDKIKHGSCCSTNKVQRNQRWTPRLLHPQGMLGQAFTTHDVTSLTMHDVTSPLL